MAKMETTKKCNESIGYVKDIIQGDDGKMSNLTLQFADGKEQLHQYLLTIK